MQLDPVMWIFSLAVLIMSAVVHEVSHGWMAERLGDLTAKYQGRLTLNPIRHIDLFGSIVIPILFFFASSGSMLFGWAKPVPYNPYNLKDQKWGELKVAVAGPISNFIIAGIGGIVLRLLASSGSLNEASLTIIGTIVSINIILGVFNLIPIPPLDGSKVLYAFLPYKYYSWRQTLERIGPIFVLIVVFFAWSLIYPILSWLFTLFTGLS